MPARPLIDFHVAGDITVQAGHRLPPRKLNDFELVYFPLATDAEYRTEHGAHRLNRPTILLTRPGERHEYLFDPERKTRHLFIHFDLCDPEAFDHYALFHRKESPVVPVTEMSLSPRLIRQMLHYFHDRPNRWRALAEPLLLSVLEEMESGWIRADAGVSRASNPLPRPIAKAMQYFDRHIDGKVTVESLARQADWTHEHFTRTFQKHVGIPPVEWMNKRRIEFAAQLLLQQTDSVKSIARQAGFADEYYFYRLFRRWTGLTATAYRRIYGDTRLLELAPPDDGDSFYPLNRFFPLRSRA